MNLLPKPFLPLPKPLGKKRALLVAVQHVHRSAESGLGNLHNLEFTHRDARELRDSLISSHGYHMDDVILMLDDREHPKDLWPTHTRILQQIDRLISDAPEDCHFFFYFAGHGVEVDAENDERASMRADGRENEIICADGKPIPDPILHDHLITPLEKLKGAKLFALFDCCHSEGLLDLQRGRGPNRYSRVWKIGRDRLFKTVATVVYQIMRMNSKYPRRPADALPAQKRASTKSYNQTTYKNQDMGELNVICLSACRDGQNAHDDRKQGMTFTRCFLKATKEIPHITWEALREKLKELVEGIRTDYEAYLQDPSSEKDGTSESWTQSPRHEFSYGPEKINIALVLVTDDKTPNIPDS